MDLDDDGMDQIIDLSILRYPDRIDWIDLLDDIESHFGLDLGADMLSPTILAIQRAVRSGRREA